MADATQLFKDDEQDRLGNGYTPSDEGLRKATGIGRDEENDYDNNARSGAAEDIANREKSAANDTGNQSGGGKSTGAADLTSAEALGSGLAAMNPALGAMKGGKILSALWGNKKRKRNTIGGSIIGLIVGGGFFGMSILSGPFEFIHIAQLLTQNHFSHQNNAGDDRVSKLMRFMKTSGDIGETRLSFIESKYLLHPTLDNLKKLGFTLNTDSATLNKGVFVTTKEPGSPYYGKSDAEIKSILQEKYGKYGDTFKIADGKFYIQDKSLSGGLAKAIVSETNYSKIGTAVRSRVLGKYTFASWHPLKVLDKKVNQKVASLLDDWSKARESRLKTGVSTSTGSPSKATINETDPKTGEIVKSTSISPSPSDVKFTLESIKSGTALSKVGGVAAVVGLACMAKTIDDKVPEIRYVQVIAPLIRVGMDAITVGNQIMSGKDVDMQELALLSKQFNSVDSSGVQSNWSDAASIKADLGQTGGTDIASSTKDTIGKDRIALLAWTHLPPIPTICSNVGQVVTGAVSVVISVVSGGSVSAITGLIGGALLGPKVIDSASSLLAGEAVNVAEGGAAWGNNINYGARLAANSTAFQFGGVALSNNQVAELNAQSTVVSKSNFSSLGFMARTFNLYDYRSLVSRALDSIGNVKQTIASIVRGGFIKFGQSILSLPSHLLASAVHAAPQPYQYPFPEYGFSQAELNNSDVANPYANADFVAKVLDKNIADVAANGTLKSTTNDYVARALGCFAVDIVKSDQGWDVIPADQSPGNQNSFDPYNNATDNYSKWNCGDSSSTWLRIRFFVFDTGVMEGLGCYLGDQQSCSNDGFNSGGVSVADIVDPILAENKVKPLMGNLVSQTISANINQFIDNSGQHISNSLVFGGITLKAGGL